MFFSFFLELLRLSHSYSIVIDSLKLKYFWKFWNSTKFLLSLNNHRTGDKTVRIAEWSDDDKYAEITITRTCNRLRCEEACSNNLSSTALVVHGPFTDMECWMMYFRLHTMCVCALVYAIAYAIISQHLPSVLNNNEAAVFHINVKCACCFSDIGHYQAKYSEFWLKWPFSWEIISSINSQFSLYRKTNDRLDWKLGK